ncbi:MAG TPA: ATP-binding cassette domain-containing protein [Candidatus Dormibacteraeota bacterium]|nr:ATP-binding cassette domain-containing protein [Candidatus Dormibacteraeota bacterium]
MNALQDVTLTFPKATFTAVMGPSGSGKSSLLNYAAGLDRATPGHVVIGDIDLTQLNEKQLTLMRRRHVGFVFQSLNLLPALTAEQNILLSLRLANRPAGPEREWLYELVERMGIGGRFQVDMRTPAEVSQQESPSSVTSLNAAISFLAVLGVFVVFIAVVVSANTYSTSVLKRTREIALLRAVAATTNQVRLLIVGESLVVSPVAAAVGCVAGVQLAAVFAPILVQGGLAPVGFRAPVSLLPLLLAIAISVGAGVLSVVTAVWRVARIRPVDAFQEAAVERPAIGPIRVLAGLAITMFGAS